MNIPILMLYLNVNEDYPILGDGLIRGIPCRGTMGSKTTKKWEVNHTVTSMPVLVFIREIIDDDSRAGEVSYEYSEQQNHLSMHKSYMTTLILP